MTSVVLWPVFVTWCGVSVKPGLASGKFLRGTSCEHPVLSSYTRSSEREMGIQQTEEVGKPSLSEKETKGRQVSGTVSGAILDSRSNF